MLEVKLQQLPEVKIQQLLEVKLQQLFEIKLHHCQKQSYKKLLPDKVKEKPVV